MIGLSCHVVIVYMPPVLWISEMSRLNRRAFLCTAAIPFAAATVLSQNPTEPPAMGFGFGTYGMKSLSTGEALRCCAEIGYDGVELALIPGWPTEPTLLSVQDRAGIRQQLDDLGLVVPSLLESLPCLRSDADHRTNLDKLKRATELAHDLASAKLPVVQSIVGGKTDQWEQQKRRLVDQLSDWARVGESSGTVICFKPHAAHIVHNPQRALWLHDQVGSEWLMAVYDFSHFFLEGIPLSSSLKDLLPIVPYVQVKDSRGTPSQHEYLLPGDGGTDYLQLLTILKHAHYRGFVNVEVSSMIHRQPGYDPVATARLCYQRLAPLFEQVEIPRRRRAQ